MTMKKLINNPETVVRELLEGVVAVSGTSALIEGETIVVQAHLPQPGQRQVAVISGGGSGHEPAHAGFVGSGMLTAAVAGDVFTSPSADAVLTAIRAVSGPAGALLIVKNYTGDRLNFGMAAEMARADGIPVEIVVVADDVALRDTVPAERRRGIAGTLLVHKAAGAGAAEGMSLEDVARIARSVSRRVSSMGVSLGACTLPSVGKPGFLLGEGEIELGLGIHGEPGVERAAMASADVLVAHLIDMLMTEGGAKRGKKAALLVNGLGSTPPMELAVLTRSALSELRARGIDVARAWTGTFLSALDMPGFSLSLMPIEDHELMLFDAPTEAPAWPRGGKVATQRIAVKPVPAAPATAALQMTSAGKRLHEAVADIARALIEAEDQLAELDAIAGDGDLGASMRRGAEAMVGLGADQFATVAGGLLALSGALRKAIAGSSGPFYAVGLVRASRCLASLEPPQPSDLAEAFSAAVAAISDLGGAKPGDRTMIDALQPACETFSRQLAASASPRDAWRNAVAAAREGMHSTVHLYPRLGRASYLGERAMGSPDAGAFAVVVWLSAVAASLDRSQ